jgi:hypothetical protein
MSFCFPSWGTSFSPAFHEDAKAMLEGALNKVNRLLAVEEHQPWKLMRGDGDF